MEKESCLWAVITVLIIGGATSLTVGFVMIEWTIVAGGLLLLIGAVCIHTIIRLLRLKRRCMKEIA